MSDTDDSEAVESGEHPSRARTSPATPSPTPSTPSSTTLPPPPTRCVNPPRTRPASVSEPISPPSESLSPRSASTPSSEIDIVHNCELHKLHDATCITCLRARMRARQHKRRKSAGRKLSAGVDLMGPFPADLRGNKWIFGFKLTGTDSEGQEHEKSSHDRLLENSWGRRSGSRESRRHLLDETNL